MPRAAELEPVINGVCLWRSYDGSVKAELYSTALDTSAGTYLIDPIPLAADTLGALISRTAITGIIVTNENHERAAAEFAEQFDVPIYMEAALAAGTELRRVVPVNDYVSLPGLTVIGIEGGPAGEIAIHLKADGGTVVVGDALINFEPYGFTLLPAKYCTNFKSMRRSLTKLLDYPFERTLFAHGMPILSRARERLELLLKENS